LSGTDDLREGREGKWDPKTIAAKKSEKKHLERGPGKGEKLFSLRPESADWKNAA